MNMNIQELRHKCEQTAKIGRTGVRSVKKALAAVLEERALRSAIFDTEIVQADDKALNADRYNALIRLLRNADNKDARQIILTRLACQEEICQPREIIAEETLRTVRKEIQRQLRFLSEQDCAYFHEVNCWKQFAQRLIEDYKSVKYMNNKKTGLILRGYTEREVSCVLDRRIGVRTDISVACQLVAHSSNVQFSSVRNAYARISRHAV